MLRLLHPTPTSHHLHNYSRMEPKQSSKPCQGPGISLVGPWDPVSSRGPLETLCANLVSRSSVLWIHWDNKTHVKYINALPTATINQIQIKYWEFTVYFIFWNFCTKTPSYPRAAKLRVSVSTQSVWTCEKATLTWSHTRHNCVLISIVFSFRSLPSFLSSFLTQTGWDQTRDLTVPPYCP